MEKTELWRARLIAAGYFALLLSGAYLGVRLLFGAAAPFLLAFAAAWALQRPAELLSRKTGLPRKAAAGITVLLGFAVLGLLLTGIILLLGSGLAALSARAPDFVEHTLPELRRGMDETLGRLLSALPEGAAELCAGWEDGLIGGIRDAVLKASGAALGAVGKTAARLPGVVFNVVVTVTAAFFLAMDYRRITDLIRRQLPDRVKRTLGAVRSAFSRTVGRLFGAYCKLCALTFAVLAVLLCFFVRVEGGVALAAVIAVLDLLPVLGCGTVLLPWAVGCALTGGGMTAFRLALSYAAVVLVRGVAEPKLVGASVGLHPVAALFCMCVGLRTLGFAGMILLPMAAMILRQMQRDGTLRLWK